MPRGGLSRRSRWIYVIGEIKNDQGFSEQNHRKAERLREVEKDKTLGETKSKNKRTKPKVALRMLLLFLGFHWIFVGCFSSCFLSDFEKLSSM